MKAGTVRSSIVTGVKGFDATHQNGDFGAVRVMGGIFENCTVVSNSALACAGVYCSQGGTVRNCVILGNTTTAQDASLAVYSGYHEAGVVTSLGDFDHCVGEVKINNTCQMSTVAETFKGFAKGDWSLKPASPAIDGGVRGEWMKHATDFRGRPRLRGPAPDCGAFECNCGLAIILR